MIEKNRRSATGEQRQANANVEERDSGVEVRRSEKSCPLHNHRSGYARDG